MSENKEQKKETQKQAKNDKKVPEELSDDDKILKEKIELYCSQILNNEDPEQNKALELLSKEVRDSTSSMTSIPKPFRFLKDHYKSLVDFHATLQSNLLKKKLADFLSVLSMTFGKENESDSLQYLQEGTQENYTAWGYEYIHHLAGDIGREYQKSIENQQEFKHLDKLVSDIVAYFVENNAEADAIDLLLEVDQLEQLVKYVNTSNFNRIILYLTSCSAYSADHEEMVKNLETCFKMAMNLEQYTQALRIALRLDNVEYIETIFQQCKDRNALKQLAFQLSRQRVNIDLEDEELSTIASNAKLSGFYNQLAKDLEISEAKHPDQIYKTYLEDKRSVQIDSAKGNLASTYVNAFVNVGSGKDSLMLQRKEGDSAWIYKVKNEGLIAAAGSLGMIFLWDPENGVNHVQDYLDMTDGYARAGGNLALGLFNSGIKDECDPAKALLEEQINGKEEYSRLGAIIGVGMAYAGSAREDFLETLVPFVIDQNFNVEVSAFAALSLGLIFVGKCNEEAANAILQTIMERPENQLDLTVSRYFSVALALLFMSQQDACEATLEAVKLIEHPLGKFTEVCVEGCAYIGSGNVLKIQQLFNRLHEQVEEKKAGFQAMSVISIGLIAMSEEVGNEMCVRSMNHLLQYGEITIRRAVPLALAALHLSNPKIQIQDLLAKLSHDTDDEVAQRAIMSLGLIGCGTNNSRLAGILRQLASYYNMESTSNHLFCVRLAQGLLHAGKGLVTLQPFYSDKFLLHRVSMAGVFIMLNSCLDMEHILLGKYHYMMYYLGISLYPKMLFTLDEKLELLPVNVRVGQAVDIVGQAGQPKKITGFQTHTSPVIIGYGERAELASEEFMTVADIILENIVILKKNPDFIEEEIEQSKNKKKTN